MIKHIVMWRLKDLAHGNDKATNAQIIKTRLEALQPRIPGLLEMEVGVSFAATEHGADLILVSKFASHAALDGYQSHPEHLALVPFVVEAQSERRVVDYETLR